MAMTAMTMTAIKPLWGGFSYFPHQLEGISWMLDKERKGTVVNCDNTDLTVYGGIQADDMGLGKTIQVAGTMLNNPKRATLLLAPLAMIDTWVTVLNKVGFSVFTFQKSIGTYKWIRNGDGLDKGVNKRCNVYITNYEKIDWCAGMVLDRIVLDEAHKIRNYKGVISAGVRAINARLRWAVTGTPLVNSYKDVYSLLAFIGIPLEVSRGCCDDIIPSLLIHRDLDSMRGKIEGVPPRPIVKDIVLPFVTREEEEFYLGIQGAIKGKLNAYSKDIKASSAQVFKLLLRLRQLSVHPQVYINALRNEFGSGDMGESETYTRGDWVLPATKLLAIRDIIQREAQRRRDAEAGVHKYLIFCQFIDEMDIVQDYLQNEGLVGLIRQYNGSMTQEKRDEVLAEVKSSEKSTVLLIQLQAGGVGLNLQEFDRIIFVSPWWASAITNQAIARSVRIGQREVVRVYNLLLASENDSSINIDSVMSRKAEEKSEMLQRLFAICESKSTADNE